MLGLDRITYRPNTIIQRKIKLIAQREISWRLLFILTIVYYHHLDIL